MELIRRWTEVAANDSKLLLIAAYDNDLEVRVAAIEAIALKTFIGFEEIELLSNALQVELPHLFRREKITRVIQFATRLVDGLGSTGNQNARIIAVNALLQLVNHRSSLIRAFAVQALGKLQDQRSIASLRLALHDPSSKVRREAALSLGEIKDSEAIEDLGEKVFDKVLDVRIAAVSALGKIESPEAISKLVPATTDTLPIVRANAATALARTGGVNVMNLLNALLNDPEAIVRESAKDAIQPLTESRNPASEPIKFATDEEILRALSDSDGDRRRTALKEINKHPSPKVFKVIKALINDSDRFVCLAAIRTLGKFGGKDTITVLIDAAQNNPDGGIRLLATEMLGKLKAVEALRG